MTPTPRGKSRQARPGGATHVEARRVTATLGGRPFGVAHFAEAWLRKPLNPPPGEFDLPIMSYSGLEGTDEPGFIRLRFQATDDHPDRRGSVTIAVAISVLDAAALLHGLQFVRGKGLIPRVQSPPKGRQ